MSRDPREVEMLAIINMQSVPDEVIKGIEQLETTTSNSTLSIGDNSDAVAVSQHHNGDEEDDGILKPGTKIRPLVDAEVARKLAERLYGIVANTIQELESYDDRNFLITADSNIKNPIIPNHSPHGYILKIQNSLDSKKRSFIDAQTQLTLFLGQQNIQCPKPVMNITGKYYSLERLGTDDRLNSVRLLEFVPGLTFSRVPFKTNHLFYQAGEFLGRLDNALKHFEHDAFAQHRSLWQLESAPKLSEFVYSLRDEAKQEIVEQVLQAFDKEVLQHSSEFAKGIIHGDFNEHNIIVRPTPPKPDEYRLAAIIDFGDACYSHYVFELAIAMAYMILQGEDVAIGGLVLAGYSMVRTVPEHEIRVLKVCVAARLCQSLVLGVYSHTLDPGNDYLLSTQAAGWALLAQLWGEPDEQLKELWKQTADKYLTQSTK